MSQLLRQGFIAALAPVGVPMADIIVTDNIGERACALQVKTRRELGGGDGGWHMKAKHEKDPGSSLFFVFLSFPKQERLLPDLFVLPSKLVAEVLALSYSTWLKQPGKNGKAHKEHDMRRLRPDYTDLGLAGNYGPGWLEKYRDGWDQLRAKTNG
jgi:hypothetical protein